MAADEWRMCVDWLVRCKILPEDHRAKRLDAQAFDLAQALRDGVLLCHLLNTLKTNCIDVKDFSPRPQLSQFLCLKNIRTFLQTCEKVFLVKSQDLFDPHDLFDVKNFRKVLHTLSKLSKSEIAEANGKRGFPPNNVHIREHDYYNALEDLAQAGFPPDHHHGAEEEEDIYGNLSDMALETDLEDQEELYDSVYQEEDDEIYEDLCSTRKRRRRTPSTLSVVSELPAPVSKRDFCIKELVDTEHNYVAALRMISEHFIKPLRDTMTLHDRDTVFSKIDALLKVHTGFYSELHNACTNAPGSSPLHEVFVKWKSQFLIYGDYCSNLPRAQEHIENLTKQNDAVKAKIEECERQANDGRFRLRDLLHVPMQRVLKYHLLLKELIKCTDRNSDDRTNLEVALEAMQDLSLYVNEVKRDNESLQLIQEIQSSIVDLQMPANTQLRDYGRLQKDGELKVKSHVDNKTRPRYIFLFDKVMLMGKSKGETYSFKEAIVLAEYRVDSSVTFKDSQRRPEKEKWNHSFQMVKQDNSMAYTFFAKTEDMKKKWIDAINLSLDNTQPAAGKNFVMTTFTEPKVCDVCGKLLRGIFFQGYTCPVTKECVHKECIGKKKPSTVPTVPVRPERYKANLVYTGVPSPGPRLMPLKFNVGDVITVTQRDGDWWKGCKAGDEGWFPSQYVDKWDPRAPTRKGSYLDWQLRNRKSRPESRTSALGPPSPLTGSVEADLMATSWYVGPMSRDSAGERLKSLQNGAFLVRDSENPARSGRPALSIKHNGVVRHIKIEQNSEGSFFMADTRYFHSLPELVEFYQRNELSDSFPEVKSTLMYSFKSIVNHTDDDVTGLANVSLDEPASNGVLAASLRSPPNPGGASAPKNPTFSKFNGTRVITYATAVYDYAATATTQLSLKRGERVAVLSKTGSDKGWWKGEHCDHGKVGYFPYAYVREDEDE